MHESICSSEDITCEKWFASVHYLKNNRKVQNAILCKIKVSCWSTIQTRYSDPTDPCPFSKYQFWSYAKNFWRTEDKISWSLSQVIKILPSYKKVSHKGQNIWNIVKLIFLSQTRYQMTSGTKCKAPTVFNHTEDSQPSTFTCLDQEFGTQSRTISQRTTKLHTNKTNTTIPSTMFKTICW
jgi:hypothetical protein